MTSAADLAEVHSSLGKSSIENGQFDVAAMHFRAAIDVDPSFAIAHNDLGSAYIAMGRFVDAVEAFHRAVELAPDFVAAHYNLGVALLRLGRLLDSMALFLRTTELEPAHVDAYNGVGAVLVQMGRGEDAIPAFERALEIDPDHKLARAQLMFQLARLCAWDRLEREMPFVPRLGIVGPSVPPFTMLSFEDHPRRHRARSEHYAAENFGGIITRPIEPPPAARPDRLRIGYFSSDFHDHATMFLSIRMFEAHDRDRYSVHCYSYGRQSDGPMRRRLLAAIDGFHDISTVDNETAAEAARADGIDIAVDLKGFTRGNRLAIFAHRAAPIQVTFLGYPGTSGAPFMDYLVADRMVIPADRRDFYSERLIALPHCYQPNDDQREIAEHGPGRTDAGLPEQGFVFCCFNSVYKISHVEFDIWMKLLERVEGSIFWLIAESDQVQANLRTAAERRGVDPDRVIFAPKLPLADHLARHRLADLFLDTFNCNAHTTASDALWAGLPVLTKLGEGFAARVAGSLLKAVGLDELITNNVEDYAELAHQLATDPARLDAIRTKLASNRRTMPLFDSERFTRHLEAGYELAYRRYLDGQPPGDIDVPAG